MTFGVFDSGIGGLTVVDAVRRRFPDVDIRYVADTLHAPYGEKSDDEILYYASIITDYLIDTHHIDALIVACNTATAAAIDSLRDAYPDLKIVGVEPGVKPAALRTKSGQVGVLATPYTTRSERYRRLSETISKHYDVSIHTRACPGLADAIEAGEIDHPRTRRLIDEIVTPLKYKGVDTIVLGCTHYPLVSHIVEETMGEGVDIVETGEAIAERLHSLFPKLSRNDRVGTFRLYVTRPMMSTYASAFTDTTPEHIDIFPR